MLAREVVPKIGVASMSHGIDEIHNRIHFGVEDGATVELVKRIVKELGIPADAVDIEIQVRIRLGWTSLPDMGNPQPTPPHSSMPHKKAARRNRAAFLSEIRTTLLLPSADESEQEYLPSSSSFLAESEQHRFQQQLQAADRHTEQIAAACM